MDPLVKKMFNDLVEGMVKAIVAETFGGGGHDQTEIDQIIRNLEKSSPAETGALVEAMEAMARLIEELATEYYSIQKESAADFKIDLNLEPSMKVREALPEEGWLDKDQVADYIKVVLMERAGMPKTWAIKVLEDELRPGGEWEHWARFEALDETGTPGFAGQAMLEGREDIIEEVMVYHLLPPGKAAGLAGRIAATRRDLRAKADPGDVKRLGDLVRRAYASAESAYDDIQSDIPVLVEDIRRATETGEGQKAWGAIGEVVGRIKKGLKQLLDEIGNLEGDIEDAGKG